MSDDTFNEMTDAEPADGEFDRGYEIGYEEGQNDVAQMDRDLLAEVIDGYMTQGGEFRSYDLADRLRRKLPTATRSLREQLQEAEERAERYREALERVDKHPALSLHLAREIVAQALTLNNTEPYSGQALQEQSE